MNSNNLNQNYWKIALSLHKLRIFTSKSLNYRLDSIGNWFRGGQRRAYNFGSCHTSLWVSKF